MAKRKNNAWKIILSIALIGGVAGLGYLTSGFTDWTFGITSSEEDNSFVTEQLATSLKEENGVELSVKKSSTYSLYGSQTIAYKAGPNISFDEVLYKINYADGTTPENVLSIVHDSEKKQITISCNKVFTQQITLTLYSKNDENVNAKLYIDFIEKLTINSSIVVNEGEPLSINNNITSTGGSILIDKTITSESLVFNADFVSKAEEYMKADAYTAINNSELRSYTDEEGNEFFIAEEYQEDAHYNDIDGVEPNTPEEVFASDIEYDVIGLNSSAVDVLKANKFSYQSFVNGIYLYITNVKYDVQFADGREGLSAKKDGIFNMTIANISEEHFTELFNGETQVFDYLYTINGKEYTSSFSLKINDNLSFQSITLSQDNIVF